MRLSHILTLGVKELRSLARDPVLVVLIVYSFTLSIYSAATAMPETLSRAAIAMVDEDRSPVAQRIIDAFRPPYFVPPRMITQDEMDRRMDAGQDTFAIDIPPHFQRDLLAGRQPAIQLNVDATQMSQAFTGSGYVSTIIGDEVTAFLQRYRAVETPPIGLALRARFNPELKEAWFGAVMEVINQITMLSVILAGAALIREREHGTIEHLLVMPVTPFEIMTAKVWAMALVVLAATWVAMTVVVQGALGVPIQGSVPLFMAGAAVHVFATTAMGIALGTVARSMPQFALLMILVLLPLRMLSGAVTPRESMPVFVQMVMEAAPTTHFVGLAQGILYRGAGFDVVWPQFLALAAIGVVLFGFALARFRATIGQMA